jgi:hypothetical protein
MFVTCPFVPRRWLWGPFRIWYGLELSIFWLIYSSYSMIKFVTVFLVYIHTTYLHSLCLYHFVVTMKSGTSPQGWFVVLVLTLVLTLVPLSLYHVPLSARVIVVCRCFCRVCSALTYFFLSATTQYGRQKKDTEFTINLFLGLYDSLRIYVIF